MNYRRLFLISALALSPHAFSQTIIWDGGGDGTSWSDPLNWNPNMVPVSTNDTIINAGGITVVAKGPITVRSVQSASSLLVTNGNFTITAGSSFVHGQLEMERGRAFTATGSNTVFTAAGTVGITNADFFANNGARLIFPVLTNLIANNQSFSTRTWQASGTNSTIEIPALTQLSGFTAGFSDFRVWALNGGAITLTNLSTVVTGGVWFLAQGSNAMVNLANLTNHLGTGSQFDARTGGNVHIPLLTVADGATLRKVGSATMPIAQITSITNGGVVADNAFMDLPLVTDLNHSEITLQNGGTANLSSVTDLDAADVFVRNGVTLGFPSLRSYEFADGAFRTHRLQAESSATLDLSSVTNLVGTLTDYSSLDISAQTGGRILLPNIREMPVSYIAVSANGLSSLIVLSNLVTSPGRRSLFEARNGGSVQINSLKVAEDLTLILRQTNSALTTSKMVSISNSVVTADNSMPIFNVVTNIGLASLHAINGGVLRFPGATEYPPLHFSFNERTIRAEGAGSLVDLSSVTTFSGNIGAYSQMHVHAFAGGRILLSGVTHIPASTMDVRSEGTNSLIDFSVLASVEVSASTLQARTGGAIQIPLLSDPSGFNLVLDATGTIPTSQIRQIIGGGVNVIGRFLDFSAVTNLSLSTILVNGGQLLVPNVSNIDGANVIVEGGSHLTFPALQSYRNSRPSFDSAEFRATGTGSTLDFPALIYLRGATNAFHSHFVRARTGGTVRLNAVQEIPPSHTDFSSDGTNSLIQATNVPALSNSRLEALNTGVLQFGDGTLALTNTYVLLRTNATLRAGTLDLGSASRLEGSGNFAGTLLNRGTVRPGGVGLAGSIVVTHYVQGTNGILGIEIGGTNSGSQFDALHATASATLAGRLETALIQGYLPSLDLRFPFVTAPTVTGNFSTFTGLSGGTGTEFVPEITTTDAALRTVFAAGPSVTSVSPTGVVSNSLASFSVQFSEPVNSATLIAANLMLTGPGGSVPFLSANLNGGTLAQLQFAAQAAAGNYTLQIGPGVRDIVGNPMNQDGDATNGEAGQDAFTTTILLEDDAPPLVTSVTPSGAVSNNVSALVMTFNEPIAASSFSASDISFTGPLGAIGITSLTASNNNTWIAAVPLQSTPGNYSYTVGPALWDAQTNSMTVAHVGGFTIDRSGPTVIAMLPSGAVTQAVSYLDLTFSEPLTLTSFTPADITLLGPNGPIVVESVTSRGGSVYRASFPQQTASGNYTVTVGPQIQDLARNLMNQDADAAPGEALEDRFMATLSLTLPDLLVTTVTTVSNALPGQEIQVSWVTTNSGNVAVAEEILEVISFSTDGLIGNDFRIAAIPLTNGLPAGGSLARTQTVTVPINGPAGSLRVVIHTDADGQIAEGNETNNFAIAEIATTVPQVLTLRMDGPALAENAVLGGVLSRNGPTTNDLQVALVFTDSSELTGPINLLIPDGQTEIPFIVSGVTDSIVDGTQIVEIRAHAGGFQSSSNAIQITDVDVPALSLSLVSYSLSEGETPLATITRQGDLSLPLTVSLGSSSAGQLSVPAIVTIPAGSPSTTVAIAAIDDHYLESLRGYTIAASASNHLSAVVTVNVQDDDAPVLTLTLDRNPIQESAGANATALMISRDRDSALPVDVQIEPSVANLLVVEDLITFSPGELRKIVPIATVDDALIEEDVDLLLTVSVRETLSLAPILPGASTPLTILDDDGPALSFVAERDWLCLGQGTNSPFASIVVSATRSGSAAAAISMTLTSAPQNVLTFPASVNFPAGATTTTFTAQALMATVTNNPATLITGSSPGLASAVITLHWANDCAPDLQVQNLVVPATGLTDAEFSVSYRDINLGAAFSVTNRAPGITNIAQAIYLSTDPFPGDDTLLGEVIFNGSANPYSFLDRTTTQRLPREPGTYWIIVQTDAGDDVIEISEANNFAVTPHPIVVNPAYTATVNAHIESALAGTPVTLSGTARKFGTTSPAPFELVNLHISLRDTKRVVAALTDGAGNYSAVFTPLPGEAGTYTVGASHPGVTEDVPAQDTFTLLGMRANPATLRVTFPALTTVTQEVVLANLGDVALTGLSATVIGLLPEFSAAANVPGSLAPFATLPIQLTLRATMDTNVMRTFTVRVTSTEGAVADVIVTATSQSLRPRLVASPTTLSAGAVPGQQRFVEFDVSNEGGAVSGPLAVQLPVLPFLRSISPATLPSLAPGESNVVTLQLAPEPGQTLGAFTGNLVVSDGTAQANVPFEFRIVSTNSGTLHIDVTDQFTYYAEGAPRVAGAAVELRDPYSGIILTNRVTDATGQVFFSLTEGYYSVRVTSDQHAPYQGTVFVVGAETTRAEALMSRETVQFFWTVAPTELQDRTRITIEAVFETVVPVPVVTVSPSVIDLADFPNGGTINMTITNHGLLAANDVQINFSNFDCWRITPLVSDLGTLAARSSITVPVTICRDLSCSADFSSCSPVSGTARPSSPQQQAQILHTLSKVKNASRPGGGCGGGGVIYTIPCGGSSVGGGAPIGVANAGGGGCGGGIGSGGAQGGGGLGGGGTSSGGGNCNPCAAEIAGVLAGCALDYLLPIPDIISCATDSYECITEPSSIGCAKAVVSCLEAAGKNVPLLGDILDVLDCADKVAAACSGDSSGGSGGSGGGGNGGNGSSGLRPELIAAKGIPRDAAASFYPGVPEVSLAAFHCRQVIAVYSNIFGGQKWMEAASTVTFTEWFPLLQSAIAETSESADRIGATERDHLLTHPLTNLLTIAEIEQFIDRWNRTIDYADAGIYSTNNVSAGLSTDFIVANVQSNLLVRAEAAQAEAVAAGFSSVFEELRARLGALRAFINQPTSGICAQVRLKIDQEAVIARDAFKASLEIVNGASTSLSNITVTLFVLDEAGHLANDRFAIPQPNLSGLSDVTGSGLVTPGNRGEVSWTIVPTTDSASNSPSVYYVSGSIRYMQDGAMTTVPLASQSITVHPLAQLDLTYFHQRDVFGDDPFTADIEPSVPYSLAVMVKNSGFGTARNVRITSAQPEIIENEKGLFIDFQIIATEVAGQNLVPALTAAFGDVSPGQIKIGRWLLKSTLQGLFTEYSATFEHLDSFGDPRASIIRSADIRELIRVVSAPGIFNDNLPDMLVNDFPDIEDLPDKIYLSDGSVAPVSIITGATNSGVISSSNLQVTVTGQTRSGWTYLRAPNSAGPQFKLVRAARTDGVPLSVGTNVWTTDRTFIGGGKRPLNETNVHILDYNGPGSYVLTYETLPEPDMIAPTSSINPLPPASFPQIPLTWTGSDAGSGIASYTIFVSDNGAPFTPWLERTTFAGAIYPGIIGHQYAFYSVATDLAGNSELPPPTGDATTTASRTNSAPILAAPASVTVPEGTFVQILNSASDADSDVQSLTFSLGAGSPPNATIHPATGLISWPTGEGNGPSTNVIQVIVTDNGSPALSTMGSVTVVITEINSAPVVTAITNRTINELALLSIPIAVSDPDVPVNQLNFQLAGAPIGMGISSNGLITWTPGTTQGPSTNSISVIVRDNGVPSLSATQRFTVIVRDSSGDFTLTFGSTHLLAGATGSVPISVDSTLDLASVIIDLETPGARLTNLALTAIAPQLASFLVIPNGPNRTELRLNAATGEVFDRRETLALLTFTAVANSNSTIVPLRIIELEGERTTGQILTDGTRVNGRVIVIGEEPVLAAEPPNFLTIYGRTNRNYFLELSHGVGAGAEWNPAANTVLSNALFQRFVIPLGSSNLFYRARQD